MARIPKRLFGPGVLTAAATTKYTTPALTKTIIRQLHFNNTDSAARTVTASIGADAVGTELFTGKAVAANDVYDWYGYAVVDAAEIVQAFASVTGVVNATCWGDEIVLG